MLYRNVVCSTKIVRTFRKSFLQCFTNEKEVLVRTVFK